jgi:hypothetical protein
MSRWISWVRPVCLPRAASRGLARVRRARQHAVLGGHPALALAAQERRHGLLDARRAQHVRVTAPYQHRAFRRAGVKPLSKLMGRSSSGCPSAGSRRAHWLRQRSTAPRRCCRCRGPPRRRPCGTAPRADRARRSRSSSGPSQSRNRAGRPTPHRCTRTARHHAAAVRRVPRDMSGSTGSPPRQHSTIIAHGVIVRLLGRDQALAHQQFHVAVVAGAGRHGAMAQQV